MKTGRDGHDWKKVAFAVFVLAWLGLRAESGYRLLGPRDLETLTAKLEFEPGDFVLLPDGTWENAVVRFQGRGTPEKPITLRPINPGKFQFSGNSRLIVEGEWLVVEGVSFRDVTRNDVPVVTMVGRHNRLTSSVLGPANAVALLNLSGQAHRIDHCSLSAGDHPASVRVDVVGDVRGHIFEGNQFRYEITVTK